MTTTTRIARLPWRPARRLLLAVAAAALGALPIEAQSLDRTGGAGVLLTTYRFASPQQIDIEKMSLLTVPVAAHVPIGRNLEVGVSGAYASGTLTRADGQSTTISGLTDTEVRLTYLMSEDRVRLSASALAPTGKSRLTAEEMDVMGVVAADLLPFAISNWGSGGGLGLNAAVVVPMDEQTSVGVSAGYVVAREYEPLSATSYAYRPGNQLHVRAAADRRMGAAAKAALQVTYVHFGQDRTAGSNFYQSGDRLQAVGSFAFAAGARATGVVYAGYLKRQLGRYTEVVGVTPAQDLVYLGTGFRQSVRRTTLVPTLELRLLGNEDGVDQGRTISAGLGAEVPTGSFDLVPLARARFGQLTVRTGQESSFTGFEVGLSIRNRTFSR